MFLAAQGDVLIEKVTDYDADVGNSENFETSTVVIASGEASGHAHRLQGSLHLFHDEALARDVPANLYVTHARVRGPGARLVHEEHAPIDLPEGTYRFRLQRRLDPVDSDFSDPYGLAGD